MKNHLYNLDLRDIWNLLNNESENQIDNTWVILADKAMKGVFNDVPVFKGLCEVMNDIAERKLKNKGKQNMKYSEEFTNFLIILKSFSNHVLDLFWQNLEGRSLQSIRYVE